MSSFVETFVSQVAKGVSLDDALAPAIESETDLRRLFATDRSDPKLTNPFIGLVDVFATHSSIRLTQARKVQGEQDLNTHCVFPLLEEKRRADGEPAMAANLDDFKTAFNIFSEGSISQLTNWDNVIVAGGSVLACLAPIPKDAQKTKRGIRKYFHGEGYPNSDIDMFIYGLTPEQVWFNILSPVLIERFAFRLRKKQSKSTKLSVILCHGVRVLDFSRMRIDVL
jgi:hypothetical protein